MWFDLDDSVEFVRSSPRMAPRRIRKSFPAEPTGSERFLMLIYNNVCNAPLQPQRSIAFHSSLTLHSTSTLLGSAATTTPSPSTRPPSPLRPARISFHRSLRLSFPRSTLYRRLRPDSA